MSHPEIPKISAKDLERRRIAVDAQRTLLLQQRLRDTAGLDELTDVFPALQAVLHPTRKRKTHKLNS